MTKFRSFPSWRKYNKSVRVFQPSGPLHIPPSLSCLVALPPPQSTGGVSWFWGRSISAPEQEAGGILFGYRKYSKLRAFGHLSVKIVTLSYTV